MGVLDFCMLIIILLINWLLNFIDGKLIWISITEFRKALTNDSHSQTMKLYLAKMVHIYYQDIYLIQRVGSRQLASRGSSDQMGHKAWHGAWSDDPRLETWHLYRSCYCYDDKFNIYPFIMRWKWKIIFVKYKYEE